MGFLDVLIGKRKIKGPAPDRIFAMATAGPVLEMSMSLKPARAAIVFQPLATSDFDAIVADMEEVLKGTGEDLGTTIDKQDDKFGYRWMILADPDFEDLVVGVNGVSTALQAGGYGERVLAAVFAFRDSRDKPVYWIYNYKRGAFYPFVPGGGEQQRDSERELQLQAQIGAELPVEAQLERWFPLWDIPI
jgi:PspAB-like protein